MANYPSPPAERMAYDRDGSSLFYIDLGGVLRPAGTSYGGGGYLLNLAANAEQGSGGFNQASTGTTRLGLVFPELRDVLGYFLNITASATVSAVETSTDTTNGLDGTWTSAGAGTNDSSSAPDEYRRSIQSVSLTGAKGFRLAVHNSANSDWTIYRFHVYGHPSTGANPDSLRVWQALTDAEIDGSYFDWGDDQRGSTYLKPFRIKNISSTQTANSISLSTETLTDSSPSILPDFTYSTDNITFSTPLNIGTIAPNTISGTLYAKFIVPTSAQLSVWAPRMVALPASWT